MRRREPGVRFAWLVATLLGGAVTECVAQHTFVGRVLDEDGASVAGTKLVARWRAAPELPGLVGFSLGEPRSLGFVSAEFELEADGRFRLDLPGRGPVALIARGPRGERQSLRRFPVLANAFTAIRLRPADFVAGVVWDEQGEPYAAGQLVLAPARTTWSRSALHGVPIRVTPLTTDAAGRFRHALEHAYLEAAMWEPFVVLRPARFGSRFRKELIVRPLVTTAKLNQGLMPRRVVRGVVQNVSGEAIAAAEVFDAAAPWRSVRSDARGAFALARSPNAPLVVRAPGYSLRLVPVEAQRSQQESGNDAGCTIELSAPRSLRLRLVDEQGRALAGHDVLWSTHTLDDLPPVEHAAVTDEDGRIELADAPVLRTTSGFVRCEGRWRRFLHTHVRKSSDLGDVTVAWRALDGLIVDASRVPHAGARVLVRQRDVEDGSAPQFWVSYSDHAGRFRFPSLPRVPLVVLVDAGVAGIARLELADPGDDRLCTVRLGQVLSRVPGADDSSREVGAVELPAGVVEVEVIGADGEPAAGCWVMLSAGGGLAAGEPASPTVASTSLFGHTRADGRVRFTGLPRRSWQVVVHQIVDGRMFYATDRVGEKVERVSVDLRPVGR